MFCPRCNTELSDAATICSQCGSPVSASSPMQSRISTFSYLPAGAPQWPTASAPLPYKAATQTAYNPDASLHELEPGQPARKRKPGSLRLPTILLLIFASILVGGGLSYGAVAFQNRNNGSQPTRVISLTPATKTTPTPGAQSSTPTATTNQLPTPLSFQQGVSADLGISIQYPNGWTQGKTQQSTNGNKDIAFRPTTQIPVTLFVLQISAANSAQLSSTADINTGLINSFGTNSNLPSPQMLTNAPTSRTIGGVSWDEEDAVFSPNTANSLRVASLAVKHTVYYYEILFYAPTSAYDEAMSKYYTKMLDSFKFTA